MFHCSFIQRHLPIFVGAHPSHLHTTHPPSVWGVFSETTIFQDITILPLILALHTEPSRKTVEEHEIRWNMAGYILITYHQLRCFNALVFNEFFIICYLGPPSFVLFLSSSLAFRSAPWIRKTQICKKLILLYKTEYGYN